MKTNDAPLRHSSLRPRSPFLMALACAASVAACRSDEPPRADEGGDTDPPAPQTGCTATSCATGKFCNAYAVCENTLATSNTYNLCYLDSDCPEGDHCSVGVCAHECTVDEACSGDLVCNPRGRCVDPSAEAALTPPVLPRGARLELDDGTDDGRLLIDYGASEQSKLLEVSNVGDGPLSVRVISRHGWLHITPAFLQLATGESSSLTVNLDRTVADAPTGSFVVLSNAGQHSVTVTHQQRLEGRFSGAVVATGPMDLGTRRLVVELEEGASGVLTGVVDGLHSPMVGGSPAVVGSVAADGTVNLSFSSVWKVHSDANPAFPRDVFSQFEFSGTRQSSAALVGTVTHTIAGVLPGAESLTITGSLTLARRGETTGLASDAPEDYEETPVAIVVPEGCPSVTDEELLSLAFRFYEVFYGLGSSGTPHGYAWQEACRASPGQTCFGETESACFFTRAMEQHLLGATTAEQRTRLLDHLKGTAEYWALAGNDALAVARSQAHLTSLDTLAYELYLATARTGLGLHGGGALSPATPMGVLDPLSIALLHRNAEVTTIRSSVFPEPTSTLEADSYDVAAHRDIYRLVLAEKAFVTSALAYARVRGQQVSAALASDDAVLRETRRLLSRALLDVAIIAELYASVDALARSSDLFVVLGPLADLQELYEAMVSRSLASPELPREVPIHSTVTHGDGRSNFQIILDRAEAYRDDFRGAANDAATLRSHLELSEEQAAEKFRAISSQFELQLDSLCGPGGWELDVDGYLESCIGGELEVTRGRIQSANLGTEEALTAYENLHRRVEIEERRLAELRNIDVDMLTFVDAQGAEKKQIARRRHKMQVFTAVLRGAADLCEQAGRIASWISAEGAAAGLAASLRTGANIYEACTEKELAFAEIDISMRREQFMVADRQRREEAESAALIDSLMLDEPNLRIEVLQAILAYESGDPAPDTHHSTGPPAGEHAAGAPRGGGCHAFRRPGG